MVSRRISASGAIIGARTRRPPIASPTFAIDSLPSSDLHLWAGTGVHECAHAVVAWASGRDISRVLICDANSGWCYNDRFDVAQRNEYDPATWRRIVRQECIYSLAGGLAEMKAYPTHPEWDGCGLDLSHVRYYLPELRRAGVRVTMDELIDETKVWLDNRSVWKAINKLVPKLLVKRRISGLDVAEVCNAWSVPRWCPKPLIEPDMRY